MWQASQLPLPSGLLGPDPAPRPAGPVLSCQLCQPQHLCPATWHIPALMVALQPPLPLGFLCGSNEGYGPTAGTARTRGRVCFQVCRRQRQLPCQGPVPHAHLPPGHSQQERAACLSGARTLRTTAAGTAAVTPLTDGETEPMTHMQGQRQDGQALCLQSPPCRPHLQVALLMQVHWVMVIVGLLLGPRLRAPSPQKPGDHPYWKGAARSPPVAKALPQAPWRPVIHCLLVRLRPLPSREEPLCPKPQTCHLRGRTMAPPPPGLSTVCTAVPCLAMHSGPSPAPAPWGRSLFLVLFTAVSPVPGQCQGYGWDLRRPWRVLGPHACSEMSGQHGLGWGAAWTSNTGAAF